MVVVAISGREFETTVLHLSGVHRNRGVSNTCVGRNRNIVQQVGRRVLIPLSSEFQAVFEHSDINTYVGGRLLLPGNVSIHIVLNRRTCHNRIAETIGHIIRTIHRLISIFTDVLITQLAIAKANLEHVYNVATDGEEFLLIETPTGRD